jgi:hypothetical protein
MSLLEDYTVTGILWVTDLEVFKFYQQTLNNSIYRYVNYNLRNTVHHEEKCLNEVVPVVVQL